MSVVPEGAMLSPDGYYWWDGTQWQLVDDPSAQPTSGVTRTGRFHAIELWFNVFIPDHRVAGAGNCFLGDDRRFDASPAASSRVHASVTVSGLGTAAAVLGAQDIHCGLTRKIDCTTETVIESDTASPFGGFVNFNVGNTHPDPEGGVYDNANEYIVTLSLDVEASDPLVPEAPSVGADLWITLDPMAGTVAVNGLIDHWPAFEGYASADGGGAVVLFQIDPAVGTDPYTLLEPRDVPVSVSVQAA